MNKFDQILSKNEVIFADGATRTNLFEKGLETGYPPEQWNVEHPKQIKSVYCEFIKAGSDMILTNFFLEEPVFGLNFINQKTVSLN
jgi:5-methyltetrahydrofolate--homocysteine methyltransferase